MNKRLSVLGLACLPAGAVLLSGLSVSCWGGGGARIPSPDRESALLADDKIQEVGVYSEPEHLKSRLFESSAAERDLSAERLVLLDTRKANKIISQVLKSDNEEAVKALLKALAKHKNESLFIEELIGILDSGKPALHPFVFAVFSGSDADKLSKTLLKELNQPQKPEPVRQRLVKGLAFVPHVRSIPFLIGLLTNRKGDLNSEILATLNVLTRQTLPAKEDWVAWWKSNNKQPREKWLEQSISEYKTQLQEKDRLIKQYADTITGLKIDILKARLEQARRLSDSVAETGLLVGALDDKNPLIKKYALEQIKTLDKRKTDQILPRLRDEINAYKASGSQPPSDAGADEARSILFDILGDLGDELSIDPLLGILNNPKESPAIKNKLVLAFRRIKNARIIPALMEMLEKESPETATVMIETVGSFGPEAQPAAPKFHEILKSVRYQNDEKLIKALIDALGDIKDPASAPEILPFISDSRTRVRWSASNSLGKIGVPDIAPQMVKLLSDEFIDIRQITIESLGKLGHKSVVPEIIKVMLNDKDLRTRQLSAETLGKINDPASLPPLIAALNEKDEKLAGSAWNALLAVTADNIGLMEETAAKFRELKLTSYASQMLARIANHPPFQTEELKPRVLQAKGMLGLILMESGEYAEAEKYLQDAVKDFADRPEYTLALIECYKKLRKYDLALASCSALLEDQKESSPEWWALKLEQLALYSELKQYAKIIEEAGKLTARNNLEPETKTKLETAIEQARKNQAAPVPPADKPAPENNPPPPAPK